MWSHPSLNVDLHPCTQCLPHPPSPSLHLPPLCITFLSLSLLFSLPVCLSIPFSLCLCLFIPQTAVTVIWSCRQCGTSRRGWTSCRLRPSSLGKSSSLSIEGLRMYVQLLAAENSSLLYSITVLYIDLNYSKNNFFILSWAGVSQWNGWWGDIQDHLFSVLSPRRLDIKTISPFLSLLVRKHIKLEGSSR